MVLPLPPPRGVAVLAAQELAGVPEEVPEGGPEGEPAARAWHRAA